MLIHTNTWMNTAGEDLMRYYYLIKKTFYGNLNMKGIADADYKHVKKYGETLK